MSLRPQSYGFVTALAIIGVILFAVCLENVRARSMAEDHGCLYNNGVCVSLDIIWMTVKVSLFP
jgi:hypothetical protein